MKKFIFIFLFFVALSFSGFIGTAQASEVDEHPHLPAWIFRRFNAGEIVEIGGDQVTIEKRDGGKYTYLVNDHTRFRHPQVETPDFSTLSIGDRVLILGKFDEEELIARLIVTLPEDFHPRRWFNLRLRGEIMDLDLDGKTITVLNRSGEEIVILVDEQTKFFGQASQITDLDIGWKVAIAGREQEDGSNLSRIISAVEYERRIRRIGIVSKIDSVSGEIRITTQNSEEMSFLVSDKTEFHSREGMFKTISDIEPDMVVVVTAVHDGEGVYSANHLFLGFPEDLPNYDLKKVGHILQVETNTFMLEDRNGEIVTFQVDEETEYRSRGMDVQGIEDLEDGMILIVGGDQEYGLNIAKLVIAIRSPEIKD